MARQKRGPKTNAATHLTETGAATDTQNSEVASEMPETGAAQSAGKKKRKKLTLKQRVIRLVIRITLLAAAIWVLTNIIGGVFICHTSDMYPALRDGDLVITFRLGTYRSTDIVAYDYDGKTCFGRIVGEPGDEIVIDENGTFTVNGTRPYETIFYDTMTRESDTMTYPYIVAEGEYFVLADAREQGFDSRSIGPVTDLKGKVVLQLRRRGF